jgi:predicted outer membrane repeat protein
LAGNSDVLFEGAQFQENTGRPIMTLSRGVKLHVKNSNFTDNKLPWKDLSGGALWLEEGAAVVESSVFSGNVVLMNGGAIAVGGNLSSLDLSSSVFKGNNGELGAVGVRGFNVSLSSYDYVDMCA